MASSAKAAPKEKQHGSPRLAPRPTAASAARAARIATNRNLVQGSGKAASERSPHPGSNKAKSPSQKIRSRSNSATDFQAPHEQEPDIFIVDKQSVPATDLTASRFQNEKQPMDYKESRLSNVSEDESRERPPTPPPPTPPTPQLPAGSSRPSTPSSRDNRPTTPSHPAIQRPTTPKKPSTPSGIPRTTTPNRRPTMPLTSEIKTNRTEVSQRPLTASSKVSDLSRTILSQPKTPTTSTTMPQEAPASQSESETKASPEDLITTFAVKEKQFKSLKKELDIKQQSVLELFGSLRELRERMDHEGLSGAGENLQREIVVFNVADWTTDQISQLYQDATSSTERANEVINSIVPIDESSIIEVNNKLTRLPNQFADLCLQAFTVRQEVIDWVKDILKESEDGGGEAVQRIAYFNKQGLELCDFLRDLKHHADETVKTVANMSRRACQEKCALVKVGESLLREVEKLRADIEQGTNQLNHYIEIRNDVENLETLRNELEEERAAKAVLKEKLSVSESQLRQTRQRVAKMDQQLREAEASIASLTGTVKSIEDQFHQKEIKLEARARKLRDSLKTGEITATQVSQQRDELRNQIEDLQQQITTLNEKHKAEINDMNAQMKTLKKSLEEVTESKNVEKEAKMAAQRELHDSLKQIEELKTKIKEIESKPDLDLPTQREMDLWAQLQTVKDTLRATEEEMASCKKEKVQFLEALTKISETDNKVGMQQKLAAELLNKEEIIGKLQSQFKELQMSMKLNELKVLQYEKFIRDYLSQNKVSDGNMALPEGVTYDSLQQEIINLRMNLLETAHRNEELSNSLMQKEQQLDTQVKTSKAQATVIKVREELINMLKNKETKQSRELTALQKDLEQRMKLVDEVNHQIAAKAGEIQELFATLESKQQQIHRMEKIVLALEEQQRRSQAQRTRHEEKIAALEHEIAAGNREKKFLFF